jgi:hypothetical protein
LFDGGIAHAEPVVTETRLVSSDEIDRRGIGSFIEPDTCHPIPLRRQV